MPDCTYLGEFFGSPTSPQNAHDMQEWRRGCERQTPPRFFKLVQISPGHYRGYCCGSLSDVPEEGTVQPEYSSPGPGAPTAPATSTPPTPTTPSTPTPPTLPTTPTAPPPVVILQHSCGTVDLLIATGYAFGNAVGEDSQTVLGQARQDAENRATDAAKNESAKHMCEAPCRKFERLDLDWWKPQTAIIGPPRPQLSITILVTWKLYMSCL